MKELQCNRRSSTRHVGAMWGLGVGVILALALLLPALGQTSPQAAAGGSLRRTRVHVLLSPTLFRGTNRHDVIAAFKPWFDIIGRERGFVLDSQVDVPPDHMEIEKRLRQRKVDVLMLDFVDYFRLESHGLLVADLTEQRGSDPRPGYSYVVLTRAESGINALAHLQGKVLRHHARTASDAGLAWLDVTMAKAGLGRAASYIGTRTPAARPQDCVLPLFFGRADACVVDELSFELLKEMNPQLSRLRVIARSERIIETVIARPIEPHPYLADLWDATLSLHLNPRGRQVLTVFKIGRLSRMAPEHMAASRRLWQEYRKLNGSLPAVQQGLSSWLLPWGAPWWQPWLRLSDPAPGHLRSARNPPGGIHAWKLSSEGANSRRGREARWRKSPGGQHASRAASGKDGVEMWRLAAAEAGLGYGVRRGPGWGTVWEGWMV